MEDMEMRLCKRSLSGHTDVLVFLAEIFVKSL